MSWSCVLLFLFDFKLVRGFPKKIVITKINILFSLIKTAVSSSGGLSDCCSLDYIYFTFHWVVQRVASTKTLFVKDLYSGLELWMRNRWRQGSAHFGTQLRIWHVACIYVIVSLSLGNQAQPALRERYQQSIKRTSNEYLGHCDMGELQASMMKVLNFYTDMVVFWGPKPIFKTI